MTGDMVAALARATAEGCPLFGHNSCGSLGVPQPLHRSVGRAFALGEKLRTRRLDLPQARQTYTVLGSQPVGSWGYSHGVNEHQVAAGCVALPATEPAGDESPLGLDLVRLILERSQTAQHAVDLLTEQLERLGRDGSASGFRESDFAFLVGDGREAFAVETAGPHWVYQEVQQVRAACAARVIRQDWDRISRGLAGQMIDQGRWPGDGSKLDFAAALGGTAASTEGLRRWGRATFLLEQSNGRLDVACVRRILADHCESVAPHELVAGEPLLCRHAVGAGREATRASLIVDLGRRPDRLPIVWCAFGPPCSSVYFPIFLEGELPAAFTASRAAYDTDPLCLRIPRLSEDLLYEPERWAQARESLDRLQARFDQEALEFAAEGAELKRRGNQADLERLASLCMQHHLERFAAVVEGLVAAGQAVCHAEEVGGAMLFSS
jgi:dipeptidase